MEPEQDASLRQQKKIDTRRAMARAAAELFLAGGAEGMTVSAIARRAGVSTRTFHNYFPSREDALMAFIEEAVDDWAAKVERSPAEESLLDLMHRLILGRIDQGEAGNDAAGLLNLILVSDYVKEATNAKHKAHFAQTADRIVQMLYRKHGGTMSYQATSLLFMACLGAGAIAVDVPGAVVRGDQSGTGQVGTGCCFGPGRPDDGEAREPKDVLDELFAYIRRGFGQAEGNGVVRGEGAAEEGKANR